MGFSGSLASTCTLEDLAKVNKLLSSCPPNGAASASSELSFKTASSGQSSMLSAHGPHCFLPNTVLPFSLGNYQSVDTFSEGDTVFSANGTMVKITFLEVHPIADRQCVQLWAGDVTNEFTESHRVSIWRAGREQAVRAATLRPGDDVFKSGGVTQKLSDVRFFAKYCQVYEFMFEPDLPVESYPDRAVPPGAILTHGRKPIRRSHKPASSKGGQPSSVPEQLDTDSEWGFAEYS